jgi:hypothetical protein
VIVKRKCSYENGLTTEEVNLKQVNLFTAFSAVKGIVLATSYFYFSSVWRKIVLIALWF